MAYRNIAHLQNIMFDRLNARKTFKPFENFQKKLFCLYEHDMADNQRV